MGLIKQNPLSATASHPPPAHKATTTPVIFPKSSCAPSYDLGDIDDDDSPWNVTAIALWLAFLATLTMFFVEARRLWKRRETTEESPDDDDLEVGFDRRRKESDSRADRSEKSEPGNDQEK